MRDGVPALCEANPSSARRLAGEWLYPPAIQVLRELGIDLSSEIPEHARGQRPKAPARWAISPAGTRGWYSCLGLFSHHRPGPAGLGRGRLAERPVGTAARVAGALLGRLRWLVVGILSGRDRGESRPALLYRVEPGRGVRTTPPSR
jgi:hypothetical protein